MSLVAVHHNDSFAMRDLGLWTGAAAVVIAAHLGIAAGIWAFQDEPQPAGAPETAIMIELAPITTSIDAPEFEEVSELDAQKMPETPPEPIEEPELIEPVEPPPLDPWEAPVIEIPEVETPPVKPEVVLPAEKPKPEKPREKPKKKEPERKKVKAKPAQAVDSRRSAAEAPRAERSATTEMSRSFTRSTSPATWHNRVAAHLSRHKPRASARGSVRITLTVDARGNILSHSARSGNPQLDEAVEAMIRRASPVPAPPADLGVTRETFTTSVTFR